MTTADPPRRGGNHPIYGIFVGGSEINDRYELTGSRHYKFTGQRRGAKVINSIEQALLSTIASKDDQPKQAVRKKPKDPWKYVEPKDLTQPINIDGKKWYFCTKCRCRATGKIGFYQLSHTDSTHDPNWKPESNLAPIRDPDPTPPAPLRPPDSSGSEPVDDDLIYTGVNCAPILLTPEPFNQGEDHRSQL